MRRLAIVLAVGMLVLSQAPVWAGDWSGDVGIDWRAFSGSPLDPVQHGNNLSVYVQPEYYHDWDDDRQRFAVTAFARFDQGDPERSHADFRELYWRKSFPGMELSIGLKKIFWGVTESAHLVDVINQSDVVENIDTEDKLGQPMINLTLLRSWGTVDLFVLPWFREQTFAGSKGRLRLPFPIDSNGAMYESSADNKHVDAAIRWSHYFGDIDIGVAHFSGTNREPTFRVNDAGAIVPYYEQMEQTSLDLQITKGDWLWKLEAFNRNGRDESFQALATGFEYTLVGLLGSAMDLGIITEYLRDTRRGLTVSDRDLAAGFRLALNDVQSTQLLAFSGVDLDNQERFTSLEGNRRLGQSWTVSLEARFFSNTDPAGLLHALRHDDYVELSVAKFF